MPQYNANMQPTDHRETTHCCLACHFLRRYIVTKGDKSFVTESWIPLDERKRLRDNVPKTTREPRADGGHVSYWCEKSVWEAPRSGDDAPPGTELTIDREGSCFFFPYHDGMAREMARILEPQFATRREAEKDRELTRDTARFAVRASWAAVAIAIIVGGGNIGWGVYQYLKPRPQAVPQVHVHVTPPASQPTQPYSP